MGQVIIEVSIPSYRVIHSDPIRLTSNTPFYISVVDHFEVFEQVHDDRFGRRQACFHPYVCKVICGGIRRVAL
jgi:hypothetical protein